MEEIKLNGLYQHYKGKFYEVLFVGKNTESLENCVVYKALYNDPEFGKDVVWIRPLEMFLEMVEVNGQTIPRFKYIKQVEK